MDDELKAKMVRYFPHVIDKLSDVRLDQLKNFLADLIYAQAHDNMVRKHSGSKVSTLIH